MAQNFERVKSRLNNIQAIEPLLGALRTMSMGAWQMALNKISQLDHYEDAFYRIIFEILPHLKDTRLRPGKTDVVDPEVADTIVLIIGSERGLCGKFNQVLAEKAMLWIDSKKFTSVQIWAMGSRMINELKKMDIKMGWRNTLPASGLSSYQQSYLTTQNWLQQFEQNEYNQFFILFNQIGSRNRQQFSEFSLLPYEVSHPSSAISHPNSIWPEPIIETEPKGIYRQIIQHAIASSFYKILLMSAAAEHSARFQLMEEAKDNAEDIVEELTQVINAERKRKITQEMQELAAGAGLLDNQ